MTDPIKALAEAAREVRAYIMGCIADGQDCDDGWIVRTLGQALAAYDAAAQPPPTDAEVEAAVDAYRDACYAHAHSAIFGEDDEQPSAALAADDARKALLSLMRRARPEPSPEGK